MRGRRDGHGASSGDAAGSKKWVWRVAQTTRARWAWTGDREAGEPMAVASPAASRVGIRAWSWSISGSRVRLPQPLKMVWRTRSPLCIHTINSPVAGSHCAAVNGRADAGVPRRGCVAPQPPCLPQDHRGGPGGRQQPCRH